jgi:hypothetical protein
VPAALELAKNPFSGHLPLEMLDGALDALLPDDHLDGLALDGVPDLLGRRRILTLAHASSF